jgi:hypothetical protein
MNVPSERHRFDVWSFIFGAAFAVLAALVIWLPVEPGWAIIVGRAMGPAILVLIGIGLLVSVWQRRRPDEPNETLLAEPLGRTEDLVDDMEHAIAGDDVGLDDGGIADHHSLPIDTDR